MPELVLYDDGLKQRRDIYIRSSSKEERVKLVDFLEAEGFRYIPHDGIMDREDVLASGLPVVADVLNKVIRRMGNVTVAACAAQCKVLRTEEEFYQIYQKIKEADEQ